MRSAARVLVKTAVDVPDAELDEVLGAGHGIFAGRRLQWARLRFSAERARWVSAESWHPKQRGQFEPDGSYLLELPHANPRELVMDILRHVTEVEALGPVGLREEVKEKTAGSVGQDHSVSLKPATITTMNSFWRYWGKARPVAGSRAHFHLLPLHCLDVAAVAACWWDSTASMRRTFVHALGVPEEPARAWVLFFVALHDLGKLDVRFQLKAPEVLRELQPDVNHEDVEHESRFDHGAAGLKWAANEYRDWLVCPDDDRSVFDAWLPWLQAVTGHHGEWSSATRMAIDAEPYIVDRDRDARGAFVAEMARLFLEPAKLSLTSIPPPCGDAAQHLLAGFCAACDWLGSNTDICPYEIMLSAPNAGEYFENRTQDIQTKRWLSRMGLVHGVEPYGGLAKLLNHDESPRGVQVLVDELPAAPGLVVVEAPTGSGKTEVALAHAWRLLSAGQADSIIFALPTQATANAMLDRVKEFASKAFGDAPANIVLAHGRRDHNHAFERMVALGRGDTAQGPEEAAAQCSTWLAQSRKRVFLGQLGVCTVDQTLLSVLPVRHKFVRGFGLNKSVLIVDEVHAYDSYMHGLLAEVLRRQRDTGGSAVLLSATLPSGVREKLLSSWGAASQITSTYPAIWFAATNTRASPSGRPEPVEPIAVPRDQRPRSRTVNVETIRLPEAKPDDEVLSRIVAAATAGARVAVIVNLVGEAQTLTRRLRGLTSLPVDLFHARYRFIDRQSKEKAVLDHYGRAADRTGGRVLVATQVVEQSLDLDFDWMLTQICPVDLLFQRLGRLHRHERQRPVGFERPRCTVLTVNGVDYGLHKLIYGNTRVLWRTDQLLARQSHIDFPDAYRIWIEPVYDTTEWPHEPPAVTNDYFTWWGGQIAATQDAERMINTPRLRLFGDDDAKITIKTRDGEMSLSILPLRDDGRLLDGSSLNEMEDRAQLEALALNVVPVPHSWQGRLREVKPDDEGRYHVLMKQDGLAHSVRLPNGTLLRYTAEFGLEREIDEPA